MMIVRYLRKLNPVRFIIMVALLLACMGLEYYLHIAVGITGAYPHLFYVPLFIAAFWWGFWGGLSVGIFLGIMHTLSYVPHLNQIVAAESLAFALVGSATGVIGSERINAERKLQKAYNEEVRLRRNLQAEMERRVEFTRSLVHELKTPLTPILASSELLIEELRQEPLLSLARNINRGAVNLNDRIDELLDLARGEMGILKLNIKKVDFLALLRTIIDDAALMISSHGQSFIVDLPAKLPHILGDENRLRQIVLNLLNNASKFTPEGGTITIRSRKKDSSLVTEVKDTGPGIKLEEQQLIFEPYYRARTGQITTGGLGLGLPLCKTLVELHGGRIWVESQENQGATFGFSIPLQLTVSKNAPERQRLSCEDSSHGRRP